MNFVYELDVKIRNKVLYEALRDVYKLGGFRKRANYSFNSVSENISSILANPGKDGYEIRFNISYDGSYKIVPRVLCDVLPCFLIQLRTLFEFGERQYNGFKKLLLNKRVEIETSYDNVGWIVRNMYPGEQPNRIDEGFFIDRARNMTWYATEEYYKNHGNTFGMLSSEEKHAEELAKSVYSKAIEDYPQNNKFKEIFPAADPDSASENYDSSFEIVNDSERAGKHKPAAKKPVPERKTAAEDADLSDKKALIKLVENDASVLDSLPSSYRGDKEIVMAAIKKDPLYLSLASAEMRNDKDVVLLAVTLDGLALKFASSELQADEEVVLSAVENCGWALQYASYDLMGNRQIVKTAVEKTGLMLAYASDELRNDKEIVLKAVAKHLKAFIYASYELKDDKDVIAAKDKWFE